MPQDPRIAFFDSLADHWDGFEDLERLRAELRKGVGDLGIAPAEAVLEVGCGTGNLTGVLLKVLGDDGRLVALDFSPRMVEAARAKVRDPRVAWRVADAHDLPFDEGQFDRVVFFGVWPHLRDPTRACREAWRVLRVGGRAHVWHALSRQRINEIHRSKGGAVGSDLLVPATQTAEDLAAAGFEVLGIEDSDRRYLVTARKPSA